MKSNSMKTKTGAPSEIMSRRPYVRPEVRFFDAANVFVKNTAPS